MHPISKLLTAWYKNNKRDLPWRHTTDPYKIWLSEVILQQTQVIQGLNYYLKFIENFPTVADLAKAPEDKVMSLWQGLGYYSRARNLHHASKEIYKNYKGVFPNTYNEIKALKGIGDYTAAAVSSFAFKLPYAVVDGNVYRVLARVFETDTPINSSEGKKEFQLLADELLNKNKPDIHNSAIMELGALVCKPQNPQCSICPINLHCLAFQNQTVLNFPVKTKKTKIRDRYFNYLVFNYKEQLFIKKRISKDTWQNLYEFYLIESDKEISTEELFLNEFLKKLKKKTIILSITKLPKHILSHQHIYSTFYELELNEAINLEGFVKVKKSDLHKYGTPQLIQKYLLKKK